MKDEADSFILHPSSFILLIFGLIFRNRTLITQMIIPEVRIRRHLGQAPDAVVLPCALRKIEGSGLVVHEPG